MIRVDETLVREDEPTVNCPVEVEKVRRALELAVEAPLKNITWPATPFPLPMQPVQLVTVRASMVELGLRNSVVEATPNQLIENLVAEAVCRWRKSTPVVEALVTIDK